MIGCEPFDDPFDIFVAKTTEADLVDWLSCRADGYIEEWSGKAQALAGWPHHHNGRAHARPWRQDRLLGPKNLKRGFDRA